MAIDILKPHLSSFAQKNVTKLILRGSLIVAVILTVILIVHDLNSYGQIRARAFIAIGVLAYLVAGEALLRTKYAFWVNWLIILLYGVIAHLTLLTWGLNAPVGILSAGFVVILPSLLIGSRYIFPVTVISIVVLLIIQIVHATKIVIPQTEALAHASSFWDLIIYATVFAIFALVSWLSRRQIENSLLCAKKAEAVVKLQKEGLKDELERESIRLRDARLQEVQQLHKFAIIGQSTTATLHELSNHLSILNMDLDDLRQQSRNSQAIENAHETIRAINQMVQAARRQLNNYDESVTFRMLPTLRRSVRDLSDKFTRNHVVLKHDFSLLKSPCVISGDQRALYQIISILATNALDACANFEDAEVLITASTTSSKVVITVSDNGIGIRKDLQNSLFSPVRSAKPSGLGVGLYIAKHITETHFNGSISFKNLEKGASFTVEIPKYGGVK